MKTDIVVFIIMFITYSSCAQGWEQSYDAGYTDSNGNYAGGSEIMHLVSHKGRLYAFNGYWMDANFPGQSAQILRLDSANGRWEVDFNTGEEGIPYMKGNILKSVTFTLDHKRNLLPQPKTLLIASAGTYIDGTGLVSVFVRNDNDGTWNTSVVQSGSPTGGIRWVPRDIEIYQDPLTGNERIFLLLGDPGIISGVYNSDSNKIDWGFSPEYPGAGYFLPTRPLGIAEANGNLYFSVGGRIYQRNNGSISNWTEVYSISGKTNPDVGGIRGLTAISNPGGPGESLIFVWTPDGSSRGEIIRLDGTDLTEHIETNLQSLFNNETISGGASANYSLGGYNSLFPLAVPGTGETVHLIGFEQRISGSDESIMWNNYYRGAMYAIRTKNQEYAVEEVNGRYNTSKPTLIAPRTFSLSPFPDEENVIYFGGFDANFFDATDMAWIFKAPASVVLGIGNVTDIETIDKNRIEIFPNPSSGLVNIHGNLQEEIQVELFNMNGKLVKSARIQDSVQFELENGIYFIRAVGNEHFFTQKLIIL